MSDPLLPSDDPQQRYLYDPIFHAQVNGITHLLDEGVMTVDDVKACVFLAIEHHHRHIAQMRLATLWRRAAGSV